MDKNLNYKALFAVYISDTHVTLKQSQGHQTYNENVDPEQGYNHTKCLRSCFKSVREKSTVKVFSNKEICQLSPMIMCQNQKQWYMHELLDVISNHTKFQLNWIRT